MNATAITRRISRSIFVCVTSVFVCACAMTASQPVTDETEAPPAAQSAEQQAMPTPEVSPPVAQTLLPFDEGLGLELLDSAGYDQIAIDTGGIEADYTVTRLSSPDRVVIDLAGIRSRRNRTIPTTASEFVSQVRLGAHPDKSRIVLDLQGAGVMHDVQARDGLLMVTLSRDGISPQHAAELPVAETQAAATEDAAAASGKSTSVADDLQPRLEGLSFDKVAGQNAVVADVSSAGFFSLKRTAPSEYVLRIEDALMDEEAAQTLIAPPDGGLIRTVRPLKEDNDVLLRIFVQPESVLQAKSDAGRIVVTASQDTDNMRAQAALEAPAETTPAAAPETGAAAPAEQGEEGAKGADDAELSALLGETPRYTGRLISLDLQDTDIDNALRIIAEVSNLNIIASSEVTGKVTLRLIDVPWDQALDVILKTNGLDSVQEGNVIRIAPVEKLRQERESLRAVREAEDQLEPLQVMYRRISYAKAAELKPLIETVLTERGTVAYDERTNQAIIRDIGRGVRNALELVNKLDLRTPQVLLETQIVEASRTLLRDLGSEVGFTFVQSPETGNATGYNFPNAIGISGSATGGAEGVGVNFPAEGLSAISLLFDSADGAKRLSTRISGLEREGRARVVSRPAVVTTNNKQAIIKSVEKIRVKTPSGGLSVATGQGATAAGTSAVATETIEIGITLEVTPQASPDYFVLLDINAKSSTFGGRTVEGIPSEVERSATSTVLVSSGQTFAMGGIYKITDGDRIEGVPFLKDVPFLGHLFRRSTVDNGDEELLFFITPRIVEGSFDDAAMDVAS